MGGHRNEIKHSYQLRVPSVVFESNGKDGALARWVREFVRVTSTDARMMCPKSKKHVIDVSVYSKSRQVRTCFSSKREDSTRTPLLFMDLVGGECMPQTDAERFAALLVEPDVEFRGGRGVVHVHDGDALRCVVDGASHGVPAAPVSMAAGSSSSSGGRRRVREEESGDGDGRRVRHAGQQVASEAEGAHTVAQTTSSSTGRLRQVISCLGMLGRRHCEEYGEWIEILLAVRNATMGCDDAADAFVVCVRVCACVYVCGCVCGCMRACVCLRVSRDKAGETGVEQAREQLRGRRRSAGTVSAGSAAPGQVESCVSCT